MFLGREAELSALNELYNSDTFQCVIIYGRRRVGKTTLITEFMKNKKGIFFVAQETNTAVSLYDFSERALTALGVQEYQSTFDNWAKAFAFIGEQAKTKRLVLVIDEFPYLLHSDRSITSILQNAIDHQLKDTKLFLIICGSQVSFMEKEVLGYSSPIYGRRTAQMRIEPFSFFESKQFFPNYSITEQIEAYSILGGIPLYLQQFDNGETIGSNIKKQILRKYAYLYEEPRNLMKQELREPMNYNSIIEAIADGATTINTISGKSKVINEQCSKYLNTLIQLLIVEKVLPLGEPSSSRKSVYKLRDFFFRFWYQFVFGNISELEAGMVNEVFDEEIEPNLNNYYRHAFEEICHQHFMLQNKTKTLPYRFSKIGRWWGNNPIKKTQQEIDLYAIGKQGIYLGECKWNNKPVGRDVLEGLVGKGEIFDGRKTYVLYSKSGFTEDLKETAKKAGDVLLYSLEDF